MSKKLHNQKKRCPKCGIEKEIFCFSKNKSRKDGLDGHCKSCKKEYAENNVDAIKARKKEWDIKNSEKLAKNKRAYYLENRAFFLQKAKKHQEKNKERIKAYKKDYYRKNTITLSEKRKIYRNALLKNNPIYALKHRIMSSIRTAFARRGYTKKSRTNEILGCSFLELKHHLEIQFLDGMTWENRSEWEIDHIIPLASATTEEDVIRLNHYTNLRPLWTIDNQSKRDKMPNKSIQNSVRTKYAIAKKIKLRQSSIFEGR